MFSNVVHFSQIYLPKRSGVTLCKTRLLYTFTAYCFQILHRLVRDKTWERDEIVPTAFHPASQRRSQRNESYSQQTAEVEQLKTAEVWLARLFTFPHQISEMSHWGRPKMSPGQEDHLDWPPAQYCCNTLIEISLGWYLLRFFAFFVLSWYAGGGAGLQDTKQ